MKPVICDERTQYFNGFLYRTNSNGYYIMMRNKKVHYLHRDVWEHTYGVIPKGYVVHHKNENTSDNSLDNLVLFHGNDHMRYHRKKPGTFHKVCKFCNEPYIASYKNSRYCSIKCRSAANRAKAKGRQ